jgi:alpha-tubulin suppressor-like RCC1 family protein
MRRRALAVATVLLGAGLVPAVAAADPPPAAPGGFFHSVSPIRVLDTRDSAPVGDNATITLDLSSAVPANATAVVVNLTATDVTATTFITAWPHGAALPNASDLNVVAGDTRPNHVTVQLSPDHKVDLHNAHGSVDLVADLAGYYAPGAGSGYVAPDPQRVFDTRWAQHSSVGPNGTVTVDLSPWVPASATAVVFNLTAADATASTFVTAWPDGSPRPSASNMNVTAGAIRPNLVTVAVPPSRKIDLYNHTGSVDLIVDLDGYYLPNMGDAFFPMDPDRVVDTRQGWPFGTIGTQYDADMEFNPPMPSTAHAAVLNMTGVNATDSTYLMAWPLSSAPPIEGSVLNVAPGEVAANQAILALDPQRHGIFLQNHVGTLDLVVDLAGYFGSVMYTCTTSCTYAWGMNSLGALGIGTSSAAVASPQPAADSAATAIVGTTNDSYYLGSDGTVSTSGDNSWGQLGRAPHNPPERSQLASFIVTSDPVTTVTRVQAVTAREDTVEVLKSDGTVWGWGANLAGQLGTGDRQSSRDPVQAAGVSGATGIAMSSGDTFAVRSDGTVWGWGGAGAMLGGSRNSETPVQIRGITGATAVGASDYSAYALAADETVWAWGDNDYGQLGQGTKGAPSDTPTKIPGLASVVALSSGGQDFEYALKSDGTVWHWGCDTAGGYTFAAAPVQVPGLSGVTQIATGTTFAMALKSDGTVWSWGADDAGQLGGGTARSVPAQVPDLIGITQIGAGGEHAYAVKG